MNSLWKKFRSLISQICMFLIISICLCSTVAMIVIYWKWYLSIVVLIVIVAIIEPRDDPKEPPMAGPPPKVKLPGRYDMFK